MSTPTIVLIDGHALAYRMYFALERTAMKTSRHEPTWAVYGFINALFAMLKEVKPDGVAVAFDVSRESFRTDLFPAYKAHRQSMPDAMRVQMDWILQAVETLGIPLFQINHVEADDVIGTLAHQLTRDTAATVLILTGDQDAFQLVRSDGRIKVLIPSGTPKEGLKYYDEAAIIEKWGIRPDQVVDYKALRGDTSDNIPGVPGIGEKTAAKLLGEFNSLDGVYTQLDTVKPDKLREKLTQFKDQAYLSQKLAQIIHDVPNVSVSLESLALHIPDWQLWVAFLQRCEFRTFLQQAPAVLAQFRTDLSNGAEEGSDSAENIQAVAASKPPALSTESQQGSQAAQTSLMVQVPKSQAVFVPEYRIISAMPELETLLAAAKAQGVLVIDLETTGLDPLTAKPVGFALATGGCLKASPYTPVNPLNLKTLPCDALALTLSEASLPLQVAYVPVGHLEASTPQLSASEVLDALAPLLKSPHVIKIAHNAKYELGCLTEWYTSKKLSIALDSGICSFFDTMLASYVLNPERRHGLKALGSDLLGLLLQDISQLIGTGKKQRLFSEVSIAEGAPYAACDAYLTLTLAQRFVSDLSHPAHARLRALLQEVELPLVAVLSMMERTGISVDVPYLKALGQTLNEQLIALEAEIHAMAGLPFNLNSPKQVGEILFDRLGIAPGKKTAGKTAYSTDAQVLEQLAPDYPIVGKLLEYRQLFKIKSTYVDALPQLVHPETGRVHSSLNQAVAATGRLSSSEPNLQNIPVKTDVGQKIRQAFVPEKNWFLLSADYSQIELRLLAHFSEDPELMAAFEAGDDVHARTASLVFDVPLADVTKAMRYQAKTVNFGVIYGQTAHGLSQQLGVSRADAQDFITRYFQTYPRVKAYIDEIKTQAHRDGYVETLYGRRRWLKEGLGSSVRSIREFAERAAFNTPLQGSASDLIKLAMTRLVARLEETRSPARLLLQVHDELVLEAPQGALDETEAMVRWAMGLKDDDDSSPLKVPLVVDVSIGQSWLEA
ncbi:MAG: DNA polymerase I [Vampirovibrionales bacterium]|nr:DNA polymerase I [Vampirovibrionales bacterium]